MYTLTICHVFITVCFRSYGTSLIDNFCKIVFPMERKRGLPYVAQKRLFIFPHRAFTVVNQKKHC